MNNDLRDPMQFLGFGMCRVCMRPTTIRTLELTVVSLDQSASPLTSASVTRHKFHCPYCGYEEDAIYDPVDMIYRPSSPITKAMIEAKLEEAKMFRRHYEDSSLIEK